MHEASDRLLSAQLCQYFGTRLTPLTFDEWVQVISGVVSSGRRSYLSGHHNLRSLYLMQKDTDVKKFYARCDNCYIDGMSLRLLLAGAGVPTTSRQRFSLMDTFTALLEQAGRRGWTIFYLGSEAAVVEKARERLEREYPNLCMTLHHGYFEDDSQLIDSINSLRPDLLLVGMGMPRQESWLLEHIDNLDVAVATETGGTLDYFVGAQPKPPNWISGIGLAWLYRLAHDPVRLWRRYLLEPWALALPTLKLWSGLRRTGSTKPDGHQ